LLRYNYGLHEKLKYIIIKLRRSYFPKPGGVREITLLKFDNYGYLLFMKDIMVLLYCIRPKNKITS
jgi:hypothetical protein